MLPINRSGKKTIKGLIIGLILIIIVLPSIALAGASVWYLQNIKPLSSSTESVDVTIASGSSTSQIANELKQKKLIRSARAFEIYARLHRSSINLRAGTYVLNPSLSVAQISDVLTNGEEASSLFTIIPGMRLDQIRTRFIKFGFKEQEVDAALEPSQYVADHPVLQYKPAEANLEGYLYPESFQVTPSTTAKQLVDLSLSEMDKRITPARIAGFKAQGLSVHQALTLASIIEEEVQSPEDRKVVAQIFLTRLNSGISLGSDVTYEYAAAVFGGEATPDLDSPYNTRKYTGLPPGPIATVSESSLEAVLNPANTDYLFFLSGDDGKTYYAKTGAEHDYNIVHYCQQLCK